MSGDSPGVALVTGSDVGIGAVIARVLGAEWTIAAHGRRDRDAETAARQVRASGGSAFPISFDLSDPGQIDRAWDVLDSRGIAINAVVNNAADQALDNDRMMDPAQFASAYLVNALGPLRVARHAAERLRQRGEPGAIVNISSLAGQRAIAGRPAYSASKAALDGITRAIALEYAEHAITANGIAAGFVQNSRWDGANSKRLDWRRQGIPMGEPTDADELAAIVELLISGRIRTMTGTTIVIDGGLSVQQLPPLRDP